MKMDVLIVNEAVIDIGDTFRFVRTVLASVPLCDITEEDLTENPQFCKLLATLSQHVDQTGLSVSLKTELDKVTTHSTQYDNIQSRCLVARCTIQASLNLG